MSKKKSKNKLQKEQKPFDLYFLVIFAIIVIPFTFSGNTSDPVLSPRLLALGILILGMSIINIGRAENNRFNFGFVRMMVFPVFLLYFIWSAISLTQAINPAEGAYDLVKTLLSVVLLVFAAQVFINNKGALLFVTKSVILSSLIAASIGIYQYFTEVPGKSGYDLFMALYEIKGLMAHKNQFATSLFLMLPFTIYGGLALKKWWRVFGLYSTFMIFTNIVIIQTRAVWVASLIFVFSFGVLWFLFFQKDKLWNRPGILKKGISIAIILLVVGLGAILIFQKSEAFVLLKNRVSSIFDTDSHDNQGRLKIWESTWDMSKDNLAFGTGAGNWKISVIPYYTFNHKSEYKNWRRPHNDFLWVLSEKGVVGLVFYLLLFLIIVFYAFKILFKEKDKNKILLTILLVSGIVGYLVISLFSFPMERINHQVYLMLMMALIVSIYYQKPKTSKPIGKKAYLSIQLIALLVSATSIYYAGILINSEVYLEKIYKAMKADRQKMVVEYADKAFTKFTTISFNAMPIHVYRGIANLRMENFNQADKDLQTALGYFPSNISVLSNLAIVSAELGNSEMAIYYLKQSLNLYPNYETSIYNLVNVYYRDKDYQKAYLTLLRGNTQTLHRDHLKYMEVLKSKIDITGS